MWRKMHVFAFYSKNLFFLWNLDDSKNTKWNLFKNHPIHCGARLGRGWETSEEHNQTLFARQMSCKETTRREKFHFFKCSWNSSWIAIITHCSSRLPLGLYCHNWTFYFWSIYYLRFVNQCKKPQKNRWSRFWETPLWRYEAKMMVVTTIKNNQNLITLIDQQLSTWDQHH